MRALVIGDVHVQMEDLEDCNNLRVHILDVVAEYLPQNVVFLGDLFHNHASKNVEVERFWLTFFSELRMEKKEIIALVGNHDRPGSASSKAHSLQTFKHLVTVVDGPMVQDGVLFLPYYHDPAELVRAAQSYPDTKVVVCHAALQGGCYDNGTPIKADAFYGKDVANPDDFPQSVIVSGHIHKPAAFGKVWYPGSPRWQNMGDANISRAIYLTDLSCEDGYEESFPTNSVCRRTWKLDFSPTDNCAEQLALVRERDKVLLDIRGPLSFCEESKRALQSKGYRVRVFPTDRGVAKVSEAAGIGVAFDRHLSSYKARYGTSEKVLRDMLKERLDHV
jgi:DNA repair exonuclease SbcCD nuclease subunit